MTTAANFSSGNPNYINTGSTSRDVGFTEISSSDGSLSDLLKESPLIIEDDLLKAENTFITIQLLPTPTATAQTHSDNK